MLTASAFSGSHRAARPAERAALELHVRSTGRSPTGSVDKRVICQEEGREAQPLGGTARNIRTGSAIGRSATGTADGLRRPGPGQEWIRVGNDYVLISILSGIVSRRDRRTVIRDNR
ncbi:RcnB family protein [Mesorhizobium atlanticum]